MNNFIFVKLIQKYEIVSFDIFDTLVQRKVLEPTDVFFLAAKRCLNEKAAKHFLLDRIEAENQARLRSNNREIRIDDIYQILYKKYGELSEVLMQSEIQEEVDQCTGITENIELIKLSNSLGKKVILISDMYLYEQTINTILSKCGISNYEELFLSNRYNAVKGDGSLFAVALNSIDASPKMIIHFGDSIKADYLGARKYGVKCVLVHRKGRLKRILKKCKR